MAEDGRSCEELLVQVSAIKAAINKVGKVILEDFLEDCIVEENREQTNTEAVERMKKALDKFI